MSHCGSNSLPEQARWRLAHLEVACCLQVQQRLLDPLQQLLADNCHLTRDTAVALQHSGFEAEALQPYSVGSVAAAADKVINGSSGLLGFEVEGMSLISPHLAGILKKPLAA